MNPTLPTIDIKKYGGRQVAIVNGKVVASGRTSKEVIAKAKKKMPDASLSEIHVLAVPRNLYTIYCA